MKTFVLLSLLCLAFALAIPSFDELSEQEIQEKFVSWMVEHEKVYGHEEFRFRFATWKDNLKYVLEHNARPDVTFTVEMNKFADLTGEEFARLYLTINRTIDEPEQEIPQAPAANPSSFDWGSKGAVTGVKDQGQCGSCWSFSTTGVVEGANKIAGYGLTSLSEQELVSCDTTNYGCNGGWPVDAMSWLMKKGGLPTESQYPYTSGGGSSGRCDTSKTPASHSSLKSVHQVTAYSESALETDVATVSPVSVCIDASHRSFQLYSSGVYYESACSARNLDHAVLATGYDNTKTKASSKFWIVKNSWGTGWGQKGYIWMAKDQNNNCGIASAGVSGRS